MYHVYCLISVEPEGEAAIHAAAKNADTDMMLLLLELGAKIDRRDNLGLYINTLG